MVDKHLFVSNESISVIRSYLFYKLAFLDHLITTYLESQINMYNRSPKYYKFLFLCKK